jgi:hypothetical protein
MSTGKYLIWSHDHSAWWRAGRCGYTRHIAAAGRYERAEAIEICREANICMSFDRDWAPREIMVAEADAIDSVMQVEGAE